MFVKNITNTSLCIDAPAKINLFLQVLNRRADGFHNINSAMQAISLFDHLEFAISDRAELSIKLTGGFQVPIDENNLVSRAYRLMRSRFGLTEGLTVSLDKKIPVSAGLGGGSSDAAATLVACNLLFELGLTSGELSSLSSEIGSDLPFFFSNGQAIVTGRGEIITETSLPTDYYLLLIKPDFPVSTQNAYSALERDLTESQNAFNLGGRFRNASDMTCRLLKSGNDFEPVHLESYREMHRIKDELLNRGAMMARLSGSGPTMFGIFDKPIGARQGQVPKQHNWLLFTVKPIVLPSHDSYLEGNGRGDN